MSYQKVLSKVEGLCAIVEEKQKVISAVREHDEWSFQAHLNGETIKVYPQNAPDRKMPDHPGIGGRDLKKVDVPWVKKYNKPWKRPLWESYLYSAYYQQDRVCKKSTPKKGKFDGHEI